MNNPRSPRHDGWTYARRRAFLRLLARCGDVTLAANQVGMSASSAHRLRKRADGAVFAHDWFEAVETFKGALAEHAFAQLTLGREVPVSTVARSSGTASFTIISSRSR